MLQKRRLPPDLAQHALVWPDPNATQHARERVQIIYSDDFIYLSPYQSSTISVISHRISHPRVDILAPFEQPRRPDSTVPATARLQLSHEAVLVSTNNGRAVFRSHGHQTQ